MPVSAAQHRATTGTHQNQLFKNNRRNNITHPSVINRDSQRAQCDQNGFPLALTHVGNSPDAMYRPTEQLTLRHSTALLCLELLSQIRLDYPIYAASGNSALDSGRDLIPSVSRNTVRSDNSGNGFSATLSPVANALYDVGELASEFIARHDPLRFPGAEASPVSLTETESTTVASVVRDLKSDSYIITGEQKKNELISSLVQYLKSDGQITANKGRGVELRLRSEAAGMPIVVASLDHGHEDVNTRLTKRALIADRDPRTAEYIKAHCAFEEEVLDAQGKNQGRLLIFQAQRAENPFRMMYDNNPNSAPTPEQRGAAEGLYISAGILTLGLMPLIGKLVANVKRREYYLNQGDEICAERFKRLFVAEVATSLDVDGLPFTPRGGIKKVKPSELLHNVPEQKRAAFYTRNPRSGITKEILLELKQGKGAINDGGRKIYLKPTDKKNEFVTFYPDAAKPQLRERKVIVDENNLSWRYADNFDSSGLNVQLREGKQQIKLDGENYELHQNSAGDYEIVVNKVSGIKEYVPVYMEPLSQTWHLSVNNKQPVFSKNQKEIIQKIRIDKKVQLKRYYHVQTNNPSYYGAGKVLTVERGNIKGDFVEMAGDFIPVRASVREGQGVRYEVYDMKFPEKDGYPIAWDGNRWLFEGVEPTLKISSGSSLSQGEKGLIQEVTTDLQTRLGDTYDKYLMRPKENCANAARDVAKEMKKSTYTDVKIAELGFWPNGGGDTMPTNHYIVMAKKGETDIVVDLTAGQFERYGFSGPIISTKENWIYQWQSKMKDTPRILVKMAPVDGGIATSPFQWDYTNPQDVVPGGTLLQRPDWYKRGVNADSGIGN